MKRNLQSVLYRFYKDQLNVIADSDGSDAFYESDIGWRANNVANSLTGLFINDPNYLHTGALSDIGKRVIAENNVEIRGNIDSIPCFTFDGKAVDFIFNNRDETLNSVYALYDSCLENIVGLRLPFPEIVIQLPDNDALLIKENNHVNGKIPSNEFKAENATNVSDVPIVNGFQVTYVRSDGDCYIFDMYASKSHLSDDGYKLHWSIGIAAIDTHRDVKSHIVNTVCLLASITMPAYAPMRKPVVTNKTKKQHGRNSKYVRNNKHSIHLTVPEHFHTGSKSNGAGSAKKTHLRRAHWWGRHTRTRDQWRWRDAVIVNPGTNCQAPTYEVTT